MATTPNYSWIMPDPTDLVKDLPADFAIFGNAVDSTVKTNADAAIAKTIVDAKGDIIAATAADTVARLAVGANNTVLTADSSTATGLKWASAGSSPTWSLLSTTATTSGTSVTVSSLSGYNQFLIRFSGISSAVGGEQYFLQFNGVTTGNKYVQMGMNFTGDSAFNSAFPGTSAPSASNNLDLGGSQLAASTINGYLFLQGGNGSSLKVGHYVTGGNNSSSDNARHRWRSFVFDDTNVISSLTLSDTFGSGFDAGNIFVYGSAN